MTLSKHKDHAKKKWKPKKGKNKGKIELEHQTYFEMQEEAWFSNDCQGNIEDYGW